MDGYDLHQPKKWMDLVGSGEPPPEILSLSPPSSPIPFQSKHFNGLVDDLYFSLLIEVLLVFTGLKINKRS